MTYKDLLKNINSKSSNIYLLFGEESYIIQDAIDSFKKFTRPEFRDFNYTVIDDKNIEVNKLLENFESVPFMDDYRVVIVRTNDFFMTTNKSISKEDEKKILEYIDNPCKTTLVIFCPIELDKRSAIYKSLKKKHVFFEANKMPIKELKQWCKEVLDNNSTIIQDEEIIYFINKTGYYYKESSKNLFDLKNELLKLAAIYHSDGEITKEKIDLITTENFEKSIFKLIDEIFIGNFKNSIWEFNKIIDSGESVLLVMTMIGKQLSTISKYHVLKSKGYNENLIIQKISIHPYTLKKAGIHSGRISFKESLVLLNLCLDTDYRIKTGQIQERLGVELIITKICQRIQIGIKEN